MSNNDPKYRDFWGVDRIRVIQDGHETRLDCLLLKNNRINVLAVENTTDQPVQLELEVGILYIAPGSKAFSRLWNHPLGNLLRINDISLKNLHSPLPEIQENKDSVYAFTLGRQRWGLEINSQDPYHRINASPLRQVSISLPDNKTKLVTDLFVEKNKTELHQILDLMRQVQQAYSGVVDQNPWERFRETWSQKPYEVSYQEWLDVCKQLLDSAPANIQRV